jgi:hypothetical protein
MQKMFQQEVVNEYQSNNVIYFEDLVDNGQLILVLAHSRFMEKRKVIHTKKHRFSLKSAFVDIFKCFHVIKLFLLFSFILVYYILYSFPLQDNNFRVAVTFFIGNFSFMGYFLKCMSTFFTFFFLLIFCLLSFH